MHFEFSFLLLALLPVVLLAIWAVYRLVTRKPKGPVGDTLREDRKEPPELTGTEQSKQRLEE